MGEWAEILEPLRKALEDVSQRIEENDEQVKALEKKDPAAVRLQQIRGAGSLISLTFVLTLDDHLRFRKSRQIGPYLGLRPRQRDSGEQQPQLRITQAGDRYLRSLLIQGAQYILGRGPDTDLKRWGKRLGGARRKECEEAGGGGGGAEAGGADAPDLGGREPGRAVAAESQRRSVGKKSWKEAPDADGLGDCEVAAVTAPIERRRAEV